MPTVGASRDRLRGAQEEEPGTVHPTMTAATVGVDLAESDDPRSRWAGYELLRTLADG